jgi:hypothetical protein
MMTKKKPNNNFKDKAHLGAAVARPFVEGAKEQLERYVEAQAFCKHDPIGGVNRCQYEVSSLFEHLATVVIYLELCGIQHPDGQMLKDVRNHIRHDIREEFDEDKKIKADRAKRLGLNPKLQMDLHFLDDGIQVGGTKIENTKISSFLQVADMAVHSLMTGGKVGRI